MMSEWPLFADLGDSPRTPENTYFLGISWHFCWLLAALLSLRYRQNTPGFPEILGVHGVVARDGRPRRTQAQKEGRLNELHYPPPTSEVQLPRWWFEFPAKVVLTKSLAAGAAAPAAACDDLTTLSTHNSKERSWKDPQTPRGPTHTLLAPRSCTLGSTSCRPNAWCNAAPPVGLAAPDHRVCVVRSSSSSSRSSSSTDRAPFVGETTLWSGGGTPP